MNTSIVQNLIKVLFLRHKITSEIIAVLKKIRIQHGRHHQKHPESSSDHDERDPSSTLGKRLSCSAERVNVFTGCLPNSLHSDGVGG